MSPKRETTYEDLVELQIDDAIEEANAADLEAEQLDFDDEV
jgi:hypothetical protein